MSRPSGSWNRSVGTLAVATVAIGTVAILLAGSVAAASSSHIVPLSSASTLVASVYSHSGVVNDGAQGAYHSAKVYSHAGAISTGPVTHTAPVPALVGSVVFVFVGFVNSEIGGGYVSSVTDNFSDSYSEVYTTGYAQNHTQSLYVSSPVRETGPLWVSVTFAGGDTVMGGSVAMVDVQSAVGVPTVDTVSANNGTWSSPATVSVTTTHSNELLLLGVSGMGRDAPLSPAAHETLLDTAGNTSGPWADGTGYGTFSARANTSASLLSATLATPAEWTAIGVAIYGFGQSNNGGTTTTPSTPVAQGSVAFVFVGFVNVEIGGGYIATISDNLHDNYTLVADSAYVQNHTQELFVSPPIARNASLRVSVAFTGADTPMGGSVALVDVVAHGGTPKLDGVGLANGTWSGKAKVAFKTSHSGDLLLLGVSGMGRDAPFSSGAGETLLNTGTNTSGPWEDGTGYGTFSASEHGKNAALSATLATPAEWTAIGVGIHAIENSKTSTVLPSFASSFGARAGDIWAVLMRWF